MFSRPRWQTSQGTGEAICVRHARSRSDCTLQLQKGRKVGLTTWTGRRQKKSAWNPRQREAGIQVWQQLAPSIGPDQTELCHIHCTALPTKAGSCEIVDLEHLEMLKAAIGVQSGPDQLGHRWLHLNGPCLCMHGNDACLSLPLARAKAG